MQATVVENGLLIFKLFRKLDNSDFLTARYEDAVLTLWPRMRSVVSTHARSSDMSEFEVVSQTFLTSDLVVLMGRYCRRVPQTKKARTFP